MSQVATWAGVLGYRGSGKPGTPGTCSANCKRNSTTVRSPSFESRVQHPSPRPSWYWSFSEALPALPWCRRPPAGRRQRPLEIGRRHRLLHVQREQQQHDAATHCMLFARRSEIETWAGLFLPFFRIKTTLKMKVCRLTSYIYIYSNGVLKEAKKQAEKRRNTRPRMTNREKKYNSALLCFAFHFVCTYER